MIKVFSDLTGKYYDSTEAAEKAEQKFNEEKVAAEKAKIECTKKIEAIKKQRDDEVKACATEIDTISAKIDELIAKRGKLRADIQHINDEAAHEISKCEAAQPATECSVKVKTFDSSKDKDWHTIIDAEGTFDDVIKKLKAMKPSDADLKKLINFIDF